ncbi:MAG TPA: signal recognition particle-docking protein FtsY [Burkholderiales bacterium]|nr:signal recognition particle-docking protein FtsY [Burkholderiales bacterium]
MLESSSETSRQGTWTARLKHGLAKTHSRLSGLFRERAVDPGLYEDLEAALLASDAGVDATRVLMARLREISAKARTSDDVRSALRTVVAELVATLERPFDLGPGKPCVILLAGVNGAGKTTSAGKLAKFFRDQGRSVLLAAGDTFRAAAREQLTAWGEKNDVAIVAQSGGNPAAVAFDAVAAARARGTEVLIVDTAGRLPTQAHLMEELAKVKRVVAKAEPGAPQETWLVLDANTGQNALNQVKIFDEALGLTGLILTKLDGTAKGGVVCAIALARPGNPLPLRFLGVGEGAEDLRPFAAREFAAALIG